MKSIVKQTAVVIKSKISVIIRHTLILDVLKWGGGDQYHCKISSGVRFIVNSEMERCENMANCVMLQMFHISKQKFK